MNLTVNCAEAKEMMISCVKAKLTPFITGSPGVGKSSIVAEIAKQFKLKLIDFRLSQADPTDLNGFPYIDPVTKVASYTPMDTFPIESTPLPTYVDDAGNTQTYDGWLLFLDEFNSASLAVQKATYKLVLDRMIGQHRINPKVVTICAGNLESDNAITSKLSTAMQSRLVHLQLHTDVNEWIHWANSALIDHRIVSYIQFNKNALNMFDELNKKKAIQNTFPCQRTWEFTHRLIKNEPDLTVQHKKLLSGVIGEGAAAEFIGYVRVYQDLPTIDEIIKNPLSAKVPDSADCRYAVTGLLANYADDVNSKAIIQYASRLPTEFTVITMQGAIRRSPLFAHNESVNKWIEDNYDHIV